MVGKSPSFEGSLKSNHETSNNDASAGPAQALRRVVRYDTGVEPHFKKTFKISAYIHLGLLLGVWIWGFVSAWLGVSFFPWESKPVQMNPSRTAIRVDIVDLPKLKLSELNKVDALEDIAAEPSEDKKISDTVMQLREDAAKDAARLAEAEKDKKAESEKSSKQRLKELQQNMRAEARRKELMEKLSGDMAKAGQGGREVLAGNQVSAGYATQGELATETDAYNGKLRQHLRQFWQVPGWMTVSKLRARVLVKLAPDGRVLEQKFLQKSGNTEFDVSVEQALTGASPFPAPPTDIARVYMEEGVEWGFPE